MTLVTMMSRLVWFQADMSTSVDCANVFNHARHESLMNDAVKMQWWSVEERTEFFKSIF